MYIKSLLKRLFLHCVNHKKEILFVSRIEKEITMEELEKICFEIISNVGIARGAYIESIRFAKRGLWDEANDAINKGDNSFTLGHLAHATLIQNEANKIKTDINLLLIHAEDQLMSAESFKILADLFIESYKEIDDLKSRIM